MCDKTINTYSSPDRFASECFMTQEMCNKEVNRCFFVFDDFDDDDFCISV